MGIPVKSTAWQDRDNSHIVYWLHFCLTLWFDSHIVYWLHPLLLILRSVRDMSVNKAITFSFLLFFSQHSSKWIPLYALQSIALDAVITEIRSCLQILWILHDKNIKTVFDIDLHDLQQGKPLCSPLPLNRSAILIWHNAPNVTSISHYPNTNQHASAA